MDGVGSLNFYKKRHRLLHSATAMQSSVHHHHGANLRANQLLPLISHLLIHFTRHASPRRSLWPPFLPAHSSYMLCADRYTLTWWLAGRRREACLQQRQVRARLLPDQQQQFHEHHLQLIPWNMVPQGPQADTGVERQRG